MDMDKDSLKLLNYSPASASWLRLKTWPLFSKGNSLGRSSSLVFLGQGSPSVSASHIARVQVHVASPSFWLAFDLDMSRCTFGLTLMTPEAQGTQMSSEFFDVAFPPNRFLKFFNVLRNIRSNRFFFCARECKFFPLVI